MFLVCWELLDCTLDCRAHSVRGIACELLDAHIWFLVCIASVVCLVDGGFPSSVVSSFAVAMQSSSAVVVHSSRK